MNRPLSLPGRAIRALVGLSTIWCLGCSGFEPIVAWLALGRGAIPINCGSDNGAPRNNSRMTAVRTVVPDGAIASTVARGTATEKGAVVTAETATAETATAETATAETASLDDSEMSAMGSNTAAEEFCCGNCCHAVSIDYAIFGTAALSPVQQVHARPGYLASVSRAPLLQPPQREV